MIEGLVFRFTERYRVDLEEARSLAHLAFLEAFKTYDRKRASFSTYVYQKICSKLFEWHRRTICRQVISKIVPHDLETLPHVSRYWFLTDLLDSLSEDGKAVVMLALDSPPDIKHILVEQGSFTPKSIRSAIQQFLVDLGWARDRISETFNEIGEALQ
jgi:hypothetical protein